MVSTWRQVTFSKLISGLQVMGSGKEARARGGAEGEEDELWWG